MGRTQWPGVPPLSFHIWPAVLPSISGKFHQETKKGQKKPNLKTWHMNGDQRAGGIPANYSVSFLHLGPYEIYYSCLKGSDRSECTQLTGLLWNCAAAGAFDPHSSECCLTFSAKETQPCGLRAPCGGVAHGPRLPQRPSRLTTEDVPCVTASSWMRQPPTQTHTPSSCSV